MKIPTSKPTTLPMMLLFPVVALVAIGCSKDDFVLSTDLEIQKVEITSGDRAAFCAGTGTLTVRLTGLEYYFEGTKKKKVREFASAPGPVTASSTAVVQGGKRIEPCGMFDISFDHLDPTPGVPAYDKKNGFLNSDCQIRLHRPASGPVGSVASAYVTHKRLMSDANSFRGKFTIPCP